jgi:hypothetical protein
MVNKKLSLVLSILVLAALACATLTGGGSQDQTDPVASGDPAPTDEVDAADAAPAATAGGDSPEGPAQTPEAAAPGSTLDLENPSLYDTYPGVESYANTLLNTFEGIGPNGEPVTGTLYMSGATQADPYASTLTFQSEGRAVLGESEVFTFTQILDTQYIVFSGQTCIPSTPGEQENPYEILLDSGGLLSGQADFIEEEAVNGVATYAYKITESNIDNFDSAGSGVENLSKGRLNLAVEGGFLVRLILVGSGRNEALSMDPDLVGDVYYELNFLDFNQPVDIQVPKSCQAEGGADSGFPLPQDASQINQFAGILSFQTELSMAEAADFYQTEMQALGCSPAQEMGSAEGLILAFDDCPDGGAQVVLAPEGDHTLVTILKMP